MLPEFQVKLNIRVPEKLSKAISRKAKREKTTVSNLIRIALWTFMKDKK